VKSMDEVIQHSFKKKFDLKKKSPAKKTTGGKSKSSKRPTTAHLN